MSSPRLIKTLSVAIWVAVWVAIWVALSVALLRLNSDSVRRTSTAAQRYGFREQRQSARAGVRSLHGTAAWASSHSLNTTSGSNVALALG